jgi:hypothetical protein
VSHPEPPREVWRGCAHCLNDDAEASPLITLPVRGGTTVLHAGCVAAGRPTGVPMPRAP